MNKTACIFVLVLVVTSARASTDPFVGKWELDVSRSFYPAGNCPKNMTIEMRSVGSGIRYISDATLPNGGTVHAEYTADYNGKQAIVMGARGMMLPVFLKRIDAHTVIASYTKGLVVVATSHRVVTEDERRMTITTTSKDGSGESLTTVGVFERK
jgi:hypothetical protein